MIDPLAALYDQLSALSAALATWDRRDNTKPQPAVRMAANDAMDAVDGLLDQLTALRSQLVSQIRCFDDATAARVDAMIAEWRPS